MMAYTPISVEEARALYERAGSAHDFEHVLRVLALAERIGPAEGADMAIVRAACLLHDVARAEADDTGQCHAMLGAQAARTVLADLPDAFVEAVAHAIAAHRFRGQVQPASLEAQVLSDADKLDALGAIGIARAYAIAGARNQRLWAAVQPDHFEDILAIPANEHTPVHEYLFKLTKLKERLYTPTARKIAEGRHQFMEQFFERLQQEVGGQA